MKSILVSMAGALALGLALTGPAAAAENVEHPKHVDWSWEGPFGTFDRASLQRGFQVYTEVCASCHSVRYLKYRNLGDAGGPGFSEAEVKALAAQHTVTDGPDDFGDMFERPAEPKDTFVSPFPNEQAAKAANGGALPPDLSLLTKGRDGGPSYVYSVLTGYEEAPAGEELPVGTYYNPYFPGHAIKMPPPLSDDLVEYADGTPATTAQMAKDVVTFLHWAAEPKLEQRKQIGFIVMVFLVLLSGLLYFTQRKIWADQH